MTETNTIPVWVDVIVKLTPAVVTVVVGGVGAYIAHLQYRLNSDRLRLDLSSKRQEAYDLLQKFFHFVFRDGQVKQEALAALIEARSKSRFLFGADINDHFEELWGNAVDAHTLHLQMYPGHGEGLPVGPERSQVAMDHMEKIKWLLAQMNQSDNRYAKYLRFEHGRGD
jgi:hypothetical protein